MFRKIGHSIYRQRLPFFGSSKSINRIAGTCVCSEVNLLPNRNYSYLKSRTEESPDKYTAFEKSYDEWKFVEKLIPPTHVPAVPTDPLVSLPSGWRPPNPSKDCTYYIRRTKNHLIPVYEKIEDRGQRRFTYICKVEGDIWQFEKDIGKYLQSLQLNPIIIRTNEISRHVIIKGFYVEQVKNWLMDKGF